MIYISSSGSDTEAVAQLPDNTLREYICNGLLPERTYIISVRGYYQLLGPAYTINARLQGNIS